MYFSKGYTDELLSSVKSVMEKFKYPHPMYNPKNGDEVVVRSKEEHEKYADKGWVHEKPVNEVEEPRPQGEKEFKAKHTVKKSGKNMDGSDVNESIKVEQSGEKFVVKDDEAGRTLGTYDTREEANEKAAEEKLKMARDKASDLEEKSLSEEEKYKEFFQKALKRFGAESPADLSKEKKKEFFDYVDKNWEAKNEEVGEEELDEAY